VNEGTRVRLIGGTHDRRVTRLAKTPRRIRVAGQVYERVEDPETGEFLGAYAVLDGRAGPASVAPGGRDG